MDIPKGSSFVGAMLLMVGSIAGWVDAPQRMAELVVRGNAVCDTGGTYTLNWVVINPETNTEVTIASAAESGAHKGGEIYLDPTNLKGGESATGSDSGVPGTTKGAVTLTVHYVFNDTGGEAQSNGSISLEGTCKK